MRSPCRRLALAAIPLLLLGATGCSLSGSVSVNSPDSVLVDVTFSDFGQANADLCDESVFFGSGLQFISTEDNAGPICRITGNLEPERLESAGLKVRRFGEYLVLEIAPAGEGSAYPSIYLTVDFPGQVVEHNANEQTAPNQVRLTDLNSLSGSGLRVVALDHAGPPWWVIGTAGGVIAGSLLTLAVVLTRRRSRTASATVPSLQPADSEPVEPDPTAPAIPASPVPLPDPPAEPSRAPEPSEFKPPGPPADNSIWAPPRDS